MIDFLIIAGGIILFWTLGTALLLTLGAQKRLLKTAPVFGAALVTLLAFILYYCGISIQVIQYFLLALLIAAAILLLRRRREIAGQWKWLAGLLGLYTLLAVPLFIGGEQYYVFRGNVFDHFFYLSESLTVYFFPASEIRALPLAQTAQTFGTWATTGQIGLLQDRPAVAVLFSCFLTPGFGDIIARAAMFNTAFTAMLWVSVQYLWDLIDGERPVRRFQHTVRFLPPLAYAVGFFNQFSFDINAWSQMTSMPVLTLMFGLYGERLRYILQLERPDTLSSGQRDLSASAIEWICLLLLAVSGCALYLEGYLSYCIALAVASAICGLWRILKKQSIRWGEVWLLPAIMTGAVLLAFLPNWEGSITFLSMQMHNATTSLSYADYFFRYWQGRAFTDSPRAVLNVIPSVLGFYYLTPDYEQAAGSLGRNLFSGGMLLLNFAIIGGIVSSTVCAVRKKRFFCGYLTGTAWITFCAFVLLLIAGQTWTAGKYLQYLSPCVFLFLCQGFAGIDPEPSGRTARMLAGASVALAAITVVCNIGFGAARIARADEPAGVGYVNTYPSILDWQTKVKYRWEADLSPLKNCETVEISTDLDNTGLYSNWLFFKALYNRLKPYTAAELTLNFWNGNSFGHMEETDCDGYVRAEDADGDGVFEAAAGTY